MRVGGPYAFQRRGDSRCTIEHDMSGTNIAYRFPQEDLGSLISDDVTSDLALRLSSPRWPVQARRRDRMKVFVFGSQVTRDAMIEGRDFVEIVEHIGRMSLVSALWQRAAPAAAIASVARTFRLAEQRMLLHDMCKTVAATLKHARYDWLVMDLVDERFPLMSLGPALVTCSGELRQLGLPGTTAGLEAGSEARYALWLASIEAMLEFVPAKRIILNRVLWAERDLDGEQVVPADVARRNNEMLEKMYDYLAPRVAHVIDYPAEYRVADPSNKWGSSPFHMTRPFYAHTLEHLARIAA